MACATTVTAMAARPVHEPEHLHVDGLAVRVIRSTKRSKTSSARLVDGVVEVRVPAWLSARERNRTVTDLVARVRAATPAAAGVVDLVERAEMLAARYDLPVPSSIRWVTNQGRRWGSCTPATGTIRISHRLQRVPDWVLDAVLVHELAHLVEPGHGPRFRALEERYPLRERAEGFLEAMSAGLADPVWCVDGSDAAGGAAGTDAEDAAAPRSRRRTPVGSSAGRG